MNILISLSNNLFCEAIKHMLTAEKPDGKNPYIVECGDIAKEKFNPDVILVDFYSLDLKLRNRYADAKLLLIDTGLDQEVVASLMFSFKIDGLLSIHTNAQLLKRALAVVNGGEIWLDNKNVKLLLHKEGLVPRGYEIQASTPREKEIIDCVAMGLSNKEIGSRLCVSEQTVKAHLSRIFKRFNVSSRSRLAALVLSSHK